MRAVLDVVLFVLDLYWWVVIAAALFSWLYAFNVVNPRNQVVSAIGQFLYAVTEPIFRWIRRVIPSFGGIDISPIIVLLAIYLIRRVIILYIYPSVF
jgi:YggT family protein